jgi:hypothetical protein
VIVEEGLLVAILHSSRGSHLFVVLMRRKVYHSLWTTFLATNKQIQESCVIVGIDALLAAAFFPCWRLLAPASNFRSNGSNRCRLYAHLFTSHMLKTNEPNLPPVQSFRTRDWVGWGAEIVQHLGMILSLAPTLVLFRCVVN